MHGLGPEAVDHLEQVAGQRGQGVRRLVVRPGRLVLAALVVRRRRSSRRAASGSSTAMKSSFDPVNPGTSRTVPRAGRRPRRTRTAARAPREVVSVTRRTESGRSTNGGVLTDGRLRQEDVVPDASGGTRGSTTGARWRARSRSPARRAASARRRRSPRSASPSPSSASEVLLVDLDPQACLTFSLGIDPEDLERSLHDVLIGTASRPRGRGRHRRRRRPAARHDRARPRRGDAADARQPRAHARRRAGRAARRTTTGSCSTARPRWASSPSTRSPRPTT